MMTMIMFHVHYYSYRGGESLLFVPFPLRWFNQTHVNGTSATSYSSPLRREREKKLFPFGRHSKGGELRRARRSSFFFQAFPQAKGGFEWEVAVIMIDVAAAMPRLTSDLASTHFSFLEIRLFLQWIKVSKDDCVFITVVTAKPLKLFIASTEFPC